ncbi:helix-turn-helix domain-containing protein [Aliikangiella sp. IMCC44359]|uniref:helix-turn-helix domain-containing protein n=1 Tax=Aliikangiella sp. IMCC44359 TaxID=3459125 RepID=UPI00403AACF7
MKKLQIIDIGKVVKLSGLPASTLRFYEEKGLIQSIGRNGLRRQYSDSVLEQLALISLGRSVGFSLENIATMLTPKGPDIDRERLAAKADELDRSILQLTAMRDGLRHAANCPAPSHLECPKFRRLLNLAGKKRFQHKHRLK